MKKFKTIYKKHNYTTRKRNKIKNLEWTRTTHIAQIQEKQKHNKTKQLKKYGNILNKHKQTIIKT